MFSKNERKIEEMPKLKIVLDNESNAFFANTMVHGKVILNLKEPMKARTFVVTVLGYAKTNWIKTIKINKNRAEYNNLAFFIQEQILLWQSSEDCNKIPTGRHTFPFQFFIPYDSPPNLDGGEADKPGSITYYVEAEISRPSKKKKVKLEFSVCPIMDLNACAKQLMSSAMCYIADEDNTVKVSIRLARFGFVCGEKIPLHVGIINKSGSNVTSIEVGIYALNTFIGACQVPPPPMAPETDSKTIKKRYDLPRIRLLVEKDGEIEFTHYAEVPPLPPSYDACGFINIQYRIFAKAHTSSIFPSSSKVSLPFVIGTLPLNAESLSTLPQSEPVILSDTDHNTGFNEHNLKPPKPLKTDLNMDSMKVEFREIFVLRDLGQDPGGFKPKYPVFLDLQSNGEMASTLFPSV